MNRILLICFLILSHLSHAKDKWYIKPSFGYCRSNVGIEGLNTTVYGGQSTEKYYYYSSNTFSSGILLILRHNNWTFNSGLYYTTTKTEQSSESTQYTGLGGTMTTIRSNGTMDFQHFIVPLTVGRRLQIDDNIFFIPLSGIECSYNFKKVSDMTTNQNYNGYLVNGHYSNTKEYVVLKGSEFTKQYNPISLWLVVQMGIEARFSKKCAMTFDLGYHYMASSIDKNASITQHGHAFFFNMGYKFRLRTQTNKIAEKKEDGEQKK